MSEEWYELDEILGLHRYCPYLRCDSAPLWCGAIKCSFATTVTLEELIIGDVICIKGAKWSHCPHFKDKKGNRI